MRGYRSLTGAFFRSQLRDPVGFFFLVVFSPILLVLLSLILGNVPAPEFGGSGPIDTMVPGMVAMSVFIVGATLIPQTQALLHTSGALTRLRMTPLSPATFYAADLTVNSVLGMIGPVLTVFLAVVVFGVDAPRNVPALIGALVLGMLAMLALGYALSRVIPSVGAATGIGNILMIILVLTSGAFVPVDVLDDATRRLFHFSPSFHIAQLVSRAWADEPWPWVSVAVLVGMTVVLGAFALFTARRR